MVKSAGILLYRSINHSWEVLLVHPGGPFWVKKDLGSWSIPKGEFSDHEAPIEAAKREFQEEIGMAIKGDFMALTPIKQNGGKIVYGFAVEGNIDPKLIKSNMFEMEWPPRSGQMQSFPEIDRGEWFNLTEGKRKINKFQATLIDELAKKLNLADEQLSSDKLKISKQSQLSLF